MHTIKCVSNTTQDQSSANAVLLTFQKSFDSKHTLMKNLRFKKVTFSLINFRDRHTAASPLPNNATPNLKMAIDHLDNCPVFTVQ